MGIQMMVSNSKARKSSAVTRALLAVVFGVAVLFGSAGFSTASNISVTDMTTGLTALSMAQALVGTGISVSNATYTGAAIASGTFSGGNAVGLGIVSGVILTNGGAANAQLPNSAGKISTANALAGDSALTTLAGEPTYDASILEFDFTASYTNISFNYVFASDEYPQYVGLFNDVFAFYLDGVNIALIPGTSSAVSINNVNDTMNSGYFVPNYPDVNGISTYQNIPYDGFTRVLTATASVTAGTHHIRIAIADTGDYAFDSAVFIQAGSLTSGIPSVTTIPVTSVTKHSALTGGTVTSNGGNTITAEGVCWSLSANPALGGGSTCTTGGTISTFTTKLTTLAPNSTYHVRAYATNSVGTGYGVDLQFSTAVGNAITSIAAGEGFSLMSDAQEMVWAFGNGNSGDLGNGSFSGASSPIKVLGGLQGGLYLQNIIAVSTKGSHAAALDYSGNVWTWGNNYYGQLGNGIKNTDNSSPNSVYQVIGTSGGYLSGITAISAGSNHTAAVDTAGFAYTWGLNGSGQLGNSVYSDNATPQKITSFNGDYYNSSSGYLVSSTPFFITIAAGGAHTVALDSIGQVSTWGDNFYGQLGLSTGRSPQTNANSPLLVSTFPSYFPLGNIVAVAAGLSHSVALDSSGHVWTWGDNSFGQLGRSSGSYTYDTVPTEVAGSGGSGVLSNITAIAAGYNFTLAIDTSGNVWAWGENTYGQLGNGTVNGSYPYPAQVTNLHIRAVAIAAGHNQSLALLADGSVFVWGRNNVGQLGDGTNADKSTPVPLLYALAFNISGSGSVYEYTLNNGSLLNLLTSAGVQPYASSIVEPLQPSGVPPVPRIFYIVPSTGGSVTSLSVDGVAISPPTNAVEAIIGQSYSIKLTFAP